MTPKATLPNNCLTGEAQESASRISSFMFSACTVTETQQKREDPSPQHSTHLKVWSFIYRSLVKRKPIHIKWIYLSKNSTPDETIKPYMIKRKKERTTASTDKNTQITSQKLKTKITKKKKKKKSPPHTHTHAHTVKQVEQTSPWREERSNRAARLSSMCTLAGNNSQRHDREGWETDIRESGKPLRRKETQGTTTCQKKAWQSLQRKH